MCQGSLLRSDLDAGCSIDALYGALIPHLNERGCRPREQQALDDHSMKRILKVFVGVITGLGI